MRFFSGFCFQNEEALFQSFFPLKRYDIAGFSYGAILAFRHAISCIQDSQRVQNLVLFSPAFFQHQTPSYKKMQVLGFRKNPQQYRENFLRLCGEVQPQYLKEGTLEELKELLEFEWKKKDLEFLLENGVKIFVFLGGEDQILSALEVLDFFTPYAKVFFYKHLNHCLQTH